jgi:dipeptidase E
MRERLPMRLYLSSYRLGNQPHRLVELLKGERAAVIFNALDGMPSDEDRRERVQGEIAELQQLGLRAEELDLRSYFESSSHNHLRHCLGDYGLVWVRGGNTFVLRRAMRYSGFDEMVLDLLHRDALVYGGFSAAVCVLTPSLRGLELVDRPDVTPTGYEPKLIWDGLGLLPYFVAPHYRSDHPESADVEKLVQYYVDSALPFKALRDGEVILVNGVDEEIVS